VVEAQPAGDDDEPSSLVIDLVHVGADQARESFLDHVLGFADIAEHSKGQVNEVGAVVTPCLGDLLVVLIMSHWPGTSLGPTSFTFM
jgi:hypothetical protein